VDFGPGVPLYHASTCISPSLMHLLTLSLSSAALFYKFDQYVELVDVLRTKLSCSVPKIMHIGLGAVKMWAVNLIHFWPHCMLSLNMCEIREIKQLSLSNADL